EQPTEVDGKRRLAGTEWSDDHDPAHVVATYCRGMRTRPLLAAPWYVWSEVHELPRELPALHTAIDPTYLASRTARVQPSAHELAHQLTNVHGWLLVVPALVIAA